MFIWIIKINISIIKKNILNYKIKINMVVELFNLMKMIKKIFTINSQSTDGYFTRNKLVYKILQHFHNFHMLDKNYYEKKNIPYNFEFEYVDNGINYIEYDEHENIWNVVYNYCL
jgi:hypothetical protein